MSARIIGGRKRLELNTTFLWHQMDQPLFRLSLELVMVVNLPRPNHHLEFRSGPKKRCKRDIHDASIPAQRPRGVEMKRLVDQEMSTGEPREPSGFPRACV